MHIQLILAFVFRYKAIFLFCLHYYCFAADFVLILESVGSVTVSVFLAWGREFAGLTEVLSVSSYIGKLSGV